MSYEIVAVVVLLVTVVIAAAGRGSVWSGPVILAGFFFALSGFAAVIVFDGDATDASTVLATITGWR